MALETGGLSRGLRRALRILIGAVVASNGDFAEAKMTEMSLDEQRETWQLEEELARIIDRELTPL